MKKHIYLTIVFTMLVSTLFAGGAMHFKDLPLGERSPKTANLQISKRCISTGIVELYTNSSGTAFQWQKDGADIPSATQNSFRPTVSGTYHLIVDNEVSNDVIIDIGDPTANFTHNSSNNACGRETVSFNNTSTGGETYLWDFGDGKTSTEKNPSHTFITDAGTDLQNFNVKLTVTNSSCKTITSAIQVISIKQSLGIAVADVDRFDPFSNCRNKPSGSNPNYTLSIANSTKYAASVISYSVDWGDGNITNGITNASFPLTHTYTQLGAFQLKVTGYAAGGCSEVFTQTVANQSNPAGGLGTLGSTIGICAPAKIPFVITNWQSNSPGTVYVLDYGDGTIETFTHPLNSTGEDFKIEHVYLKSSCPQPTFIARLLVKNACDQTPYTAGNIQINSAPQAKFSLSMKSICIGSPMKLSDRTIKGAYTNCSDMVEYFWDFGDGTTSREANPMHIYKSTGDYVIRLRTSNPCGYTEITDTICVTPKPIASFSIPATSSCGAIVLRPVNTSNETPPNCGTNTFKWTVTRNATATDCEDIGVFTTITSTLENPSFDLKLPGIYTITLTTSNSILSDCTATSFQTFTLKAPPTATLDSSIPSSICEGVAFNPTALVKNCFGDTPVSYSWEFIGANTTVSNVANPTDIVYPLKGTYTIKLTVTNECGSNTYIKDITVIPATVGGTTNGAATFCGKSSAGVISLTGYVGKVLRWESSTDELNWTVINSTTDIINYDNLSTTTFYRAIVESGMCNQAYSSVTKIQIKTKPDAPSAPSFYIYCLNENANQPTAAGLDVKWYKALPLNGANLLVEPPTPITAVTGTFKYFVTQTIDGCESDPVMVTIVVNPVIAGNSIAINQIVCLGNVPSALKGTTPSGGNNIYTYQWQSSEDGLNFADISGATAADFQPVALLKTTYYRRIVASGTCSSVSNIITITVQAKLTDTGISKSQIICFNTQPAKLSGQIPIGGNGTFTYVWEQSITSATTGFTAISGANEADFQPGVLSQTTYYRRSVISGSCIAVSEPVEVTVIPSFSLKQINNLVLCANDEQKQVFFETDLKSSNIRFSWENDNSSVGLASNGVDQLPIFTAINSSKKPVVATINYKANYVDSQLNCAAPSKIFQITVLPTIEITKQLTNKVVCNGALVETINLLSDEELVSGASVKYRWTSSQAIGLPNGEGLAIPSFTAVNATVEPVKATITVVPLYSYAGKTCEGVPKYYEITINPSAKANFSIPNQSICSGEKTKQIKLSSATKDVVFSWTAANVEGISGIADSGTDNIPEQTLVNNTTAPLTVVYKVKTITTGEAACSGAETEYSIVVNPIPDVVVDAKSKTICSGEHTNISLNSHVSGT
ncbi:PKD domain-containing protein [Nubsella zeaxanthinifaciens]|uniref:PKD domain-containing protein n=1 Tax=Nubsella zeaxanthinifaciens TaxID=392412 RepID=UPI000DE25E72|nr:PKD domain-containing protein [Nubsella zeaxanthinifaciens]